MNNKFPRRCIGLKKTKARKKYATNRFLSRRRRWPLEPQTSTSCRDISLKKTETSKNVATKSNIQAASRKRKLVKKKEILCWHCLFLHRIDCNKTKVATNFFFVQNYLQQPMQIRIIHSQSRFSSRSSTDRNKQCAETKTDILVKVFNYGNR